MTPQDMRVQDKQELDEKAEATQVSRYFVPQTDIHESADGLTVLMDMPGVRRDNVDINLEKNVLTITGVLDFSNYENLKPIYTEYNIGNYARSFTLSSEIDKEGIAAKLENGVLELRLPKVKEAAAKKIEVA